MIRRVGVIYQDRYSLGFLEGLKRRLECEAELILPDASVGRSQYMTPKEARHAWRYFQKKGVDIIVRLTDADRDRWQDVKRYEQEVFEGSVPIGLVCGVAVNNPEDWIALDPDYIAEALDLPASSVRNDPKRSDLIKGAIGRKAAGGRTVSQVVEQLVAEAPVAVFKRWLEDESFGRFYSECRAIASRFECEIRNEL